jgi:aryl-alcohol dehydrogenase-like predicted oxidoreductase
MAAWEFQTLQNIAEKHGWHKFISMQNYYNLLYREEGMFFHLCLLTLADPTLQSVK